MLQALFMNTVQMSMTAIPVILLVLLARIFLRFAPKRITYALWTVVLFRLLCPFSFKAKFSIVPYKFTTGEWIEFYINPQIRHVLAVIFIVGILFFILYSVISLRYFKKRLVGSVHLKGNIYLVDHLETPFVIGFINPKIYLPSTMSECEFEYTIYHEQYHIVRFDLWIKCLAVIALCIHWFNPFVWIAFILAMADMEMSCDEAILCGMGEEVKADYATSLLGFATGKRYIQTPFLAFGEVNPKHRIKNVLRWKEPVAIFSAIAAALAVLLGILCFFNPPEKDYREKTASIVSNNNQNRLVAEDEEYIYYVEMNEVKKISKENNLIQTLYKFEDSESNVIACEYFDHRLYFITSQGVFTAIDMNGKDLIKFRPLIEVTGELSDGTRQIPNLYVVGNELYVLLDNNQTVYRVNPRDVKLEKADPEVVNQYQVLFAEENERVVSQHFTNEYAFYQVVKSDGLSYLYRANLDGKNKTLVKEIPVSETSGDIMYDNEFVYVNMSEEEFLKIHKETLKEKNIVSITKELQEHFEVAEGRFFAQDWPYFIDSETGEKTKFNVENEEEAYAIMEKNYMFRPVEFAYLPDGFVFRESNVSFDDQYTRLHYEKGDDTWIDLYVGDPHKTSRKFVQSISIPYEPSNENPVTSYRLEYKEQTIWVNVSEDIVTKVPIIYAHFFDSSGKQEYAIQSYHVSQIEFNQIIENLQFDK